MEEESFVRRYKDYNKGVKSDPKFKQSVILCAEQNGNRAASEKYGVPYSTLRRWRRFREDIFGDDDEYIPYKGSNKWAKLSKAKLEARALMKRVFRQSARVKTEQNNSDEVIEFADKNKASVSGLATMFGVPKGHISDILKYRKVPSDQKKQPAKKNRKLSAKNIKIVARIKEGIQNADQTPRIESRLLSIMESILSETHSSCENDIRDKLEISYEDSESIHEKLSGPLSPKPLSRPNTPKLERHPSNPAACPPTPLPQQDMDKDPEEVCLRWNSHHTNMKSTFPSLLEKEQYVDVTLCSEGQTIRCHRLILSSCSAYFEEILSGITPLQHPVIFLKGTPFWILKSLIDFMYVGEVHIEQSKLQEILEVAEALKIKGLTGKNSTNNNTKPPVKEEPKSQTPPLAPVNNQPTLNKRAVPPLRLAITKEQAVAMQIEPSSLLKPTFYEETSTSSKPVANVPSFRAILPKATPGAILTPIPRKDMWIKKLTPKKKLKRKSSERDLSPPPILRKGTKSRPIVKAPKYYHMEFDNESKAAKSEDENTTEEQKNESSKSPTREPPPLEPFDISNVKCEPLDIEENDLYQEPFAPTGTIRFNSSGNEESLTKPDANENIASKSDPLRVNDDEAVNGEEDNLVIDVGTNKNEEKPNSNDT